MPRFCSCYDLAHNRPRDANLKLLKINIPPLETNQLAPAKPRSGIEHNQRPFTKRKVLKQSLEFRNLKHVWDVLPFRALPYPGNRIGARGSSPEPKHDRATPAKLLMIVIRPFYGVHACGLLETWE